MSATTAVPESSLASTSGPVGAMPFRPRRHARNTSEIWGGLAAAAVAAAWMSSFAIGLTNAVWILTIAGFLAVISGLRYPGAGLIGLGLLSVLDPYSKVLLTTSGIFRWSTLNYWLIAVGLLSIPLLWKFRSWPLRWFAALTVVIGIQLSYSTNRQDGFQHWAAIASIFGTVAYFLRAHQSPRSWFWLGAIAGVCGAVGGLAWYALREMVGTASANFMVTSPLAALACIALVYRCVDGRPVRQALLLGLAMMNSGWVFLSGSRGGILVAFCCIVYLLFSIRKNYYRLAVLAVGIGTALSLVVLFPERAEYAVEKLQLSFKPDNNIGTRTSGRSDLVRVGLNIFLENPWGIGTGNFLAKYVDESYATGVRYQRGHERPAHSGWLRTLAENGVLGIFLLVGAVASLTFSAFRWRKRALFGLGIFAGAYMSLSLMTQEFQPRGLWQVAAGAIVLVAWGLPRALPAASALSGSPGRPRRLPEPPRGQ